MTRFSSVELQWLAAGANAMRPADIDLLDVELFRERRQYEAFRVLRDQAPVHFNPEPDGPGFYALTRHEHVRAVALDATRYCSGRGTQIRDKRAEGTGAPSVHNADAPVHGRLRVPGLQALRASLGPELEARVRQIVRDLIAATPRNKPFDFVTRVAVRLPMIVFAEVLGVPTEDQEKLVDWANTMSDIHATDEEQAHSRAQLFDYFRQLAAEKRKHPGNDIASRIVAASRRGDALTDEELDAYFMLLTVAGNETTRFLIASGLEQLLLQPDDLARLRRQRELVPQTVEEMVRWVSPVVQMRRTATADCDLFGTPIRTGDKVVLYFASANRDERVFQDAGRFFIDRHPNPHVGFGAGPHVCLGAELARLEARAFFEEFLDSIEDCMLCEPGDPLPSNWFAGLTRLRLEWR
ncbi:MAG: cytochrome P450 [Gammaproteobacteria bacterium]|nr:MAG: cytochrome P450 [Gammaproteobacteria bacterium]